MPCIGALTWRLSWPRLAVALQNTNKSFLHLCSRGTITAGGFECRRFRSEEKQICALLVHLLHTDGEQMVEWCLEYEPGQHVGT